MADEEVESTAIMEGRPLLDQLNPGEAESQLAGEIGEFLKSYIRDYLFSHLTPEEAPLFNSLKRLSLRLIDRTLIPILAAKLELSSPNDPESREHPQRNDGVFIALDALQSFFRDYSRVLHSLNTTNPVLEEELLLESEKQKLARLRTKKETAILSLLNVIDKEGFPASEGLKDDERPLLDIYCSGSGHVDQDVTERKLRIFADMLQEVLPGSEGPFNRALKARLPKLLMGLTAISLKPQLLSMGLQQLLTNAAAPNSPTPPVADPSPIANISPDASPTAATSSALLIPPTTELSTEDTLRREHDVRRCGRYFGSLGNSVYLLMSPKTFYGDYIAWLGVQALFYSQENLARSLIESMGHPKTHAEKIESQKVLLQILQSVMWTKGEDGQRHPTMRNCCEEHSHGHSHISTIHLQGKLFSLVDPLVPKWVQYLVNSGNLLEWCDALTVRVSNLTWETRVINVFFYDYLMPRIVEQIRHDNARSRGDPENPEDKEAQLSRFERIMKKLDEIARQSPINLRNRLSPSLRNRNATQVTEPAKETVAPPEKAVPERSTSFFGKFRKSNVPAPTPQVAPPVLTSSPVALSSEYNMRKAENISLLSKDWAEFLKKFLMDYVVGPPTLKSSQMTLPLLEFALGMIDEVVPPILGKIFKSSDPLHRVMTFGGHILHILENFDQFFTAYVDAQAEIHPENFSPELTEEEKERKIEIAILNKLNMLVMNQRTLHPIYQGNSGDTERELVFIEDVVGVAAAFARVQLAENSAMTPLLNNIITDLEAELPQTLQEIVNQIFTPNVLFRVLEKFISKNPEQFAKKGGQEQKHIKAPWEDQIRDTDLMKKFGKVAHGVADKIIRFGCPKSIASVITSMGSYLLGSFEQRIGNGILHVIGETAEPEDSRVTVKRLTSVFWDTGKKDGIPRIDPPKSPKSRSGFEPILAGVLNESKEEFLERRKKVQRDLPDWIFRYLVAMSPAIAMPVLKSDSGKLFCTTLTSRFLDLATRPRVLKFIVFYCLSANRENFWEANPEENV
eukprot:TRINITY_DN7384_c0_g1_i1.p1 TRINITY_DN7384_c0_g1~~TRINITY_DN7384_c0_g1_i1.p1  ORF type:complete len:1052 (+),score=341.26 TRINITY_DN7384_c0_g1_i1:88-3156(+)